MAIGPFSLLSLTTDLVGKKEEEAEEEKEESEGDIGEVTVHSLTKSPQMMSPFNVRESFPSPLWTKEEVLSLFELYKQERQIAVDALVITDIFYRTNG